jgi:hypothetical protein
MQLVQTAQLSFKGFGQYMATAASKISVQAQCLDRSGERDLANQLWTDAAANAELTQ